jgi:hypothetical protein
MLVAAGLGLVAGRVARAMKDSSAEDSAQSGYGTSGYQSTAATSSFYGTGDAAGAGSAYGGTVPPGGSYPPVTTGTPTTAGTTSTTGGTYTGTSTTPTWAPVSDTSADEGSTGPRGTGSAYPSDGTR